MFHCTSFRTIVLAAALFITGATYAANPGMTFAFSPQQLLTLTAGTQVTVMLNEAIDMESVSVGNSLDFSVRSNVVVNGKVVIAAGAPATGWVKSLKKSGKSLEITITVESAQAVDGQTVNLRSIPYSTKASASQGTVNIGSNLTANVLNDIKING